MGSIYTLDNARTFQSVPRMNHMEPAPDYLSLFLNFEVLIDGSLCSSDCGTFYLQLHSRGNTGNKKITSKLANICGQLSKVTTLKMKSSGSVVYIIRLPV